MISIEVPLTNWLMSQFEKSNLYNTNVYTDSIRYLLQLEVERDYTHCSAESINGDCFSWRLYLFSIKKVFIHCRLILVHHEDFTLNYGLLQVFPLKRHRMWLLEIVTEIIDSTLNSADGRLSQFLSITNYTTFSFLWYLKTTYILC